MRVEVVSGGLRGPLEDAGVGRRCVTRADAFVDERKMLPNEQVGGVFVHPGIIVGRCTMEDAVDGVDVAAGQADEESPTVWEKHPAFRILVNLYRQHECPGTVDPLDPEDCAGVAAATVRALMQAGWLTAESEFQFAAVVDRRTHGGGLEVAKVRDTLDRAETDAALLSLTDIYPVMVMRRRRSGSRTCGEWEQACESPDDDGIRGLS